MTREHVMSTPIFDQLLREMAQRAEQRATTPATPEAQEAQEEQAQRSPAPRRRHRAD